MPEFKLEGKLYHNPVELALDKIGGKWKMPIIWRLGQRKTWRYGELKKSLQGVSHKMFSKQLKELEKDGFVNREMYAQVPPKVEYSLTPKGHKVLPSIEELRAFGEFLKKDTG